VVESRVAENMFFFLILNGCASEHINFFAAHFHVLCNVPVACVGIVCALVTSYDTGGR
jgi:hypothetical protein